MLIDLYLPLYDVSQVVELEVDAPVDTTYASIVTTDLRDPMLDVLFGIRELPLRLVRWLRREPRRPARRGPVTFGHIGDDGPGFTVLGEHPRHELVVGSVGKFWRKDYGGRRVTGEQFGTFREPGFAKLAISLGVRRSNGTTVLRYEARTATTDDTARRTFRRYWRVIRPGVALLMRRVLRRIKSEAERRTHVQLVGAHA